MSKHVERVMWPLIFQLVNKEASPGVLERCKTVALKKLCSNTIYIYSSVLRTVYGGASSLCGSKGMYLHLVLMSLNILNG